MAKMTKHRDKILEALQEWFRIHKQGPTLEELCVELGHLGIKQPRKATLQRWLQTMRGIDVEWEDNMARSLRLLSTEPEEESTVQLSVRETLRYLATGLAEWQAREETTEENRKSHLPETLRLGMSRMYLTSLLQGDDRAPSSLPEFFEAAKKPLAEWKPAAEIKYLSPDVCLIEGGVVSDFAYQWEVTGGNVEKEIQERILKDVLLCCREHQLKEEYRTFRKLVIDRPVLPYPEYRRLLASSQLRPLRDFLRETYMNLIDLAEEDSYYLCPRCRYPMKRRGDGSHYCRNLFCQQLSAQLKLPPPEQISKEEAATTQVVTPGVHQFGTIPGIWEIKLQEELTKLGVRVTLWPEIDEYDLLVEFSRKKRWAIDVKDWSHLDDEKLQTVQRRYDANETFIVFPDERESDLRVKQRRPQIEPELDGVKLKLIGEIISEAKQIINKKSHA